MPFLRAPILTPASAGQWRLVRPLHYTDATGQSWGIPAGFITDLASIPRALHWLIPVNGQHRAAAILHDYLYVVQTCARHQADALFLDAMTTSGVRWTQRHAMHAAVRVAGGLYWRRNARAFAADPAAYLARQGLATPFDSVEVCNHG